MKAVPEVSVVIPVYNEDRNIVETIEALNRFIPVEHEIICVYDFDEDTTVPILRELSETHPQLRALKNSVARGPSGALRAGFQASSAPVVMVVMADLCDDFSQIPELLCLLKGEADLICPSRYCQGGEQQLDATFKVWLPRSAGFLLKLLTGIPTYDPTNSFKVYSASILDKITLTSTVSFSVTLEIVAKAHCLGYRIKEVPTVWKGREHGASNFRIGPSIPAYLKWFLLTLLRGRFIRLPKSYIHRKLVRPEAPKETVRQP